MKKTLAVLGLGIIVAVDAIPFEAKLQAAPPPRERIGIPCA
jgi:hypothetical protein